MACTSRSPTHAEIVQDFGTQVGRMRDAVPHPGPTFADLPPEDRAAAAGAVDEESFRRAMVALVDDMQDQHAFVLPAARTGWLTRPDGIVAVWHADRVWLGLTDDSEPLLAAVPGCGGVDGSGRPRMGVRDWMLVDAVDDHAVHTTAGTLCLIDGLCDSSVTVQGTDPRGQRRCLEMQRSAVDPIDALSPLTLVAMGDMATANLQFGDPLPPESFDAKRLNELAGPILWSCRLGTHGRVGYVRMDRMDSLDATCRGCGVNGSGCSVRALAERAVQPLMDCDTIILDLAGNTGGSCGHAGQLMWRLLPRSMERVPFVHADAMYGEHQRWMTAPPEQRFGGRLIVLVDGDTASSAEHVVGCLAGAPQTILVGSPTAGCEYSVMTVQLQSRYAIIASYGGSPTRWDRPRESCEGRPVLPDVLVPVDEATLREKGPVVAAMQHRIDSLRVAWELAGLRGPSRAWVPPSASEVAKGP